MKREVKPLAMNFADPVQCSFTDGSQPRRVAGADVPTGLPRKWKHRHINRHFSSTLDHQAETTRHGHGLVPETTIKPYASPSWLVAEQPVPLSSVCHQGLPVVKKGSPATILPNDLTSRFLADGMDVGHSLEHSAVPRKRRVDDRRDSMLFTMSPNVSKFPAFSYGINPVDAATAGYISLTVSVSK